MSADEGFLADGRRLLEILDAAFADRDPGDRISILAVALGARAGDTTFPNAPNHLLISLGGIMGAAAAFRQNRRLRREVEECEGTA